MAKHDVKGDKLQINRINSKETAKIVSENHISYDGEKTLDDYDLVYKKYVDTLFSNFMGGANFLGQFDTLEELEAVPAEDIPEGSFAYVGTGDDFASYYWDNNAQQWGTDQPSFTNFSADRFYKGNRSSVAANEVLYTKGKKDIVYDQSGNLIISPEFMGNFVFTRSPVNLRGVESVLPEGGQEFTVENRTGAPMTVENGFSGPANSSFNIGSTLTIPNGGKRAFKSGDGDWIPGVVNEAAFIDRIDSVGSEDLINAFGEIVKRRLANTFTGEDYNYKEIQKFIDGTGMDPSKAGRFYKKIGDKYFAPSKLLSRRRINIVDYGAVEGEILDNYNVINDCINLCQGRLVTLEIPDGVFYTSPLVSTQRIQITGGGELRLLPSVASYERTLDIQGDYSIVRNLTVDSNVANVTATGRREGIKVSASHSEFYNVTSKNTAVSSFGNGFEINGTNNIFKDCTANNTGYGGFVVKNGSHEFYRCNSYEWKEKGFICNANAEYIKWIDCNAYTTKTGSPGESDSGTGFLVDTGLTNKVNEVVMSGCRVWGANHVVDCKIIPDGTDNFPDVINIDNCQFLGTNSTYGLWVSGRICNVSNTRIRREFRDSTSVNELNLTNTFVLGSNFNLRARRVTITNSGALNIGGRSGAFRIDGNPGGQTFVMNGAILQSGVDNTGDMFHLPSETTTPYKIIDNGYTIIQGRRLLGSLTEQAKVIRWPNGYISNALIPSGSRGDQLVKETPVVGDPAGYINTSATDTPNWVPYGKIGTGAKRLSGNYTNTLGQDHDISLQGLHLSDTGRLYNGETLGSGSTAVTVLRNPSGFSFTSGTGTQMGAIQIKLPNVPSRLTTVLIRGTVFVYGTTPTIPATAFQFEVGGYPQGNDAVWTNVFANIISNKTRYNIPVSFNTLSTTAKYIYIGELGFDWGARLRVTIDEVILAGTSGNGALITDWEAGWTVGLQNSAFIGTANETITNPLIANINIPNASTAQRGIIEQATPTEIQIGEDTERSVDPKALKDNYVSFTERTINSTGTVAIAPLTYNIKEEKVTFTAAGSVTLNGYNAAVTDRTLILINKTGSDLTIAASAGVPVPFAAAFTIPNNQSARFQVSSNLIVKEL